MPAWAGQKKSAGTNRQGTLPLLYQAESGNRNASLTQKRMCPVCPCRSLPESKDWAQGVKYSSGEAVLHGPPIPCFTWVASVQTFRWIIGWGKPV